MSYSISTLLTRNLDDVFGEGDPARQHAAIDEIFTEDCVFSSPGASTVAATRSIASLARSKQRTPIFDISRLPRPRNWAMAGGSGGSRAVLVRRQRTPGLISSLPGTAGLPPYISLSTSYPELSKEALLHEQTPHRLSRWAADRLAIRELVEAYAHCAIAAMRTVRCRSSRRTRTSSCP